MAHGWASFDFHTLARCWAHALVCAIAKGWCCAGRGCQEECASELLKHAACLRPHLLHDCSPSWLLCMVTWAGMRHRQEVLSQSGVLPLCQHAPCLTMTWRVHGMAATGAPSLHASSQHPAPSALPASQEGPLACARPQASAHGMAAAGALALRVGSQHSTQR